MPRDPELQHLARKMLIELWVLDRMDRTCAEPVNERREDVLNQAWRTFRVFWDALKAYDA